MIKTQQMETLTFPIIINEPISYIDSGSNEVDKHEKQERKVQYEFGDNVITVDRYFDGNTSINELIKQYIMQEYKFLPNKEEKYYNTSCNTAVVNSVKEESE